ncbi:PREDICTED: uncharacterized protein LOC105555667 [Vollenhovia emeryi]|uniref:uncharacterized protein LOC105555667 n=1 Tax=Vollenhovia emeryi TaxID=411798 RepID=UPI0005F50CCF|nr:PREDICTED: uncharacterized protein LOC105555667 [Vollenhovia emeryi]
MGYFLSILMFYAPHCGFYPFPGILCICVCTYIYYTLIVFLDSYEQALKKEKRLTEEKSNTGTEVQLGRGQRRKKKTYRMSQAKDNCNDSSEMEQEASSDNDSIPELNQIVHEQDVYASENIGNNDVHVLDIDTLPVVVQEEKDIPTNNHSKLYVYILHSHFY